MSVSQLYIYEYGLYIFIQNYTCLFIHKIYIDIYNIYIYRYIYIHIYICI